MARSLSARVTALLPNCVALLCLLVIAGCADLTGEKAGDFSLKMPRSLARDESGRPAGSNRFFRGEMVSANGSGDALSTDEYFDGAEWERRSGIVEDGLQTSKSGDSISLNFVDTNIREVLDVILTRTLERNFFLDERVKGKVTARTSKPIPRKSLLPMLENILALNGAALVESGGVLNIVPVGAVPSLSKKVIVDPRSRPLSPGIGIYLIPLKYVAVAQVSEVVRGQVGSGNSLAVDKSRNMLIYTGPSNEARAIADMADVLDVDSLRGMSFALFPVKSADAEDIVDELKVMLRSDAAGLSGDSIEMLAIDRMNGILVISPRSSELRVIGQWVRKLDRSNARAGSRVYVYYARNSRAADLAEVLSQVFEDSGQSISAATKTSLVAQGLEETEVGSPETLPTVKDAGAVVETSDNSIRIVADERRNALVIVATARQYELIEATLTRIDIMPLQVLLEATIAEVTLSDDLKYGLQWAISSGNFNASRISGTTSTPSSSFPGFNLVYGTPSAQVVLSALAEVTNVSVISSPQLTVLDNETARLQVGESVPISTQSSVGTTPGAPIVNTIEYFDTGVVLEVTPHVNATGQVTIEILQEVSDAVQTQTSGINSPTINQRSFKSTVSVSSGATIALGGLIRDTARNGNGGIPGAKDIPIFGNLFKSTSKGRSRTELLVLITPRVIRNPQEAREITRELRRRLSNIKALGQ